jgi:NAD dependent epimerase/dehydratase
MNLEGKRVLVTGADGFIGSHLVEMLIEKKCRVRALSYYNSFNNWGWLEDIENLENIEVVSGDVRDPFFVQSIMKDIDVVFHLAALIAIPYSYVAPYSYIETNVTGTVNICKAALENGIEKVIHTSTSEVYGTAQYVPIDEKHPLQPQSPYSASKISADSMAMSFFNSFDLPLVIARPFNTYGPRQSARAVIPTIISQIESGMKEIRLGDLSPTRDFNYVKDTCLGFIKLAESDETIGEIINIGSNFEISIKDTLELIKNIMKSDVTFVTEQERLRPNKSEVRRLWCDNSKIKKLTSFEPKYLIRKGLEETVNWFRNYENLKKYKSGIYNV